MAAINRPFQSCLFVTDVSKRVFVRNHSYGNVFHPQVHFQANESNFHMNDFAQGLVETEAQGSLKMAYSKMKA